MTSNALELRLYGLQSQLTHLIESRHQHHQVLGTSWTSVGAALIVLGALMVLSNQALWKHQTYSGVHPAPIGRLLNALAFGGDILIGAGSVVLAAAGGESFQALLAVVGIAIAIVLSLMAYYLRKYLNDDASVDAGEAPRRSWLWCLIHPLATRPRRLG